MRAEQSEAARFFSRQFLRHNHAVKEINMTSVAEASNVVRTLGKSISFAPTKPLFAQRLRV